MDLIRHTEKITRAIAGKFLLNVGELAGDTVDGLVGKLFRVNASTTGEDLDQTTSNLLVLDARQFAIGIQPIKQRIESLLRERPVFVHQAAWEPRKTPTGSKDLLILADS